MKYFVYLYCIYVLLISFKNIFFNKKSAKRKKIIYFLNIPVFSIALILNYYSVTSYSPLYITFLILCIPLLIISLIDNFKD
ncbi:hypothetical protein BEN51_08095 [Clostridium isatidis]|uniref:Uncharacterized protein n=1 Tax=Clostridium isatidis TaxID=182773 RepID=A0A343JD32_9CLOT|nr:hypothetical protein BEN51_08095 [Clostridium isatidis]